MPLRMYEHLNETGTRTGWGRDVKKDVTKVFHKQAGAHAPHQGLPHPSHSHFEAAEHTPQEVLLLFLLLVVDREQGFHRITNHHHGRLVPLLDIPHPVVEFGLPTLPSEDVRVRTLGILSVADGQLNVFEIVLIRTDLVIQELNAGRPLQARRGEVIGKCLQVPCGSTVDDGTLILLGIKPGAWRLPLNLDQTKTHRGWEGEGAHVKLHVQVLRRSRRRRRRICSQGGGRGNDCGADG
mmetsp:Transcript_4062/g.8344  ORF Transcript_4062/g.8344 Transcript_4062/m.8344 type:complete len:238 (-) Transcript_4062:257-970(-)